MNDADCVRFLHWALPRLQLRWRGFRKVRKQVCKRIDRRWKELELSDVRGYRTFLETHSAEWEWLDSACRITISRFYRDRRVFDSLGAVLLPGLAELASSRQETSVRCWSAGCGSGEEPYTVSIAWNLLVLPRFPRMELHISATDVDEHLLERARRGWYPASSLRDLPREWTRFAFDETGRGYRLRETFRREVKISRQDVRKEQPTERFHLVLCRNLVFTYFEESLQQEVLAKILDRLEPQGALIIGRKESLPLPLTTSLQPWDAGLRIYRKH